MQLFAFPLWKLYLYMLIIHVNGWHRASQPQVPMWQGACQAKGRVHICIPMVVLLTWFYVGITGGGKGSRFEFEFGQGVASSAEQPGCAVPGHGQAHRGLPLRTVLRHACVLYAQETRSPLPSALIFLTCLITLLYLLMWTALVSKATRKLALRTLDDYPGVLLSFECSRQGGTYAGGR